MHGLQGGIRWQAFFPLQAHQQKRGGLLPEVGLQVLPSEEGT